MSALDTIAGISFGGYLIAVAVNGNTAQLIETAKRDKGFLKWAIAVAILIYIYRLPGMAKPFTSIIFITFLGLFLQNGTKITEQGEKFWHLLD